MAVEEEVTQHLNQWLHHQMDAVTRPIRDTEWRIDVMMNRQKVAVEAELDGDAHGLRIVGETMRYSFILCSGIWSECYI